MTYSIVARDPENGQLGVAVQSHWFSVGTVVTWAEAGVGAVATQAFADPSYGPLALALMRGGKSVADALAALLHADAGRDRRQVGIVDANGAVAAHTGAACIAHAGHATAAGVTAQANMMRTDRVWPAMLETYQQTKGDLADRLLAALDAAEAAGGDARGRQSAAMLVVSAVSSGQPWLDRVVDLRVDDSGDPLAELRRLLTVQRGYRLMEKGELREAAGDLDAALRAYEEARRVMPGSEEAEFWMAILLAGQGKVAEAKTMFAAVAAREPGWVQVLRALPATGVFGVGDALVEALAGAEE